MGIDGSEDRTGPVRRWVLIERWAIERLDRDAGEARVEWVPMRPELVTEDLVAKLLDAGIQVGMDELSGWDLPKTEIRQVTVRRLLRELGLRHGEEQTLSENMVFWVLRGVAGEPHRVIHGTRAAREAAKELYREVLGREGRRHEGEQRRPHPRH